MYDHNLLMETSTKVIIYDLPNNVDEKFLHDFFEGYSKPKSIILQKEISGPSLCAIVEFNTSDDAVNIIKELNYTKMDDVPIRIFLLNKQFDKSACLLIKNLDLSIEASQLHETFSKYGEILTFKRCKTCKRGS